MNRASVGLIALTLLSCFARPGRAQSCGFPWTITATPAGGQSLAVHFCGSWTGCMPHNPRFTIAGDQIEVTLTAGVGTSGCQCFPVESHPNDTILVGPVATGTYTVTAVVVYCGQPETVGSTTATIPGQEVYVVRFDTARAPAFAEPPCTFLTYRDEIVFHNRGPADAIIDLLSVSNGTASHPEQLLVPAGTTRSTEGDSAAPATWAPDPQPLLWVAHLRVPDDVQLVSRLLVPTGTAAGCNGSPGGPARTYAGIAMPVVHELVPPGTPQIHLGTDIGGDAAGTADDGRTNVGVYNGGAVTAAATIELRRACDDELLTSRSVSIPPNTIIQVNGFSDVFQGCTQTQGATYETYVKVTADQPSFSYAVTLSNKRPPWIPVSSSP